MMTLNSMYHYVLTKTPEMSRKRNIISGSIFALCLFLLLGSEVFLRHSLNEIPPQPTQNITVSAPGYAIHNSTALGDSIILNPEFVDDPILAGQGLMERNEVPKDGMLFDFKEVRNQSLTMYNTEVDMDAVWLDENYQVISVTPMSVCPRWKLFFCPTYESPEPVRYVLETTPGMFAKK